MEVNPGVTQGIRVEAKKTSSEASQMRVASPQIPDATTVICVVPKEISSGINEMSSVINQIPFAGSSGNCLIGREMISLIRNLFCDEGNLVCRERDLGCDET